MTNTFFPHPHGGTLSGVGDEQRDAATGAEKSLALREAGLAPSMEADACHQWPLGLGALHSSGARE